MRFEYGVEVQVALCDAKLIKPRAASDEAEWDMGS